MEDTNNVIIKMDNGTSCIATMQTNTTTAAQVVNSIFHKLLMIITYIVGIYGLYLMYTTFVSTHVGV